jgi:hypothetical protein
LLSALCAVDGCLSAFITSSQENNLPSFLEQRSKVRVPNIIKLRRCAMHHLKGHIFVFCLLVSLSSVQTSLASGSLRVNEAATKIRLDGERVEVSLAMGNEVAREIAAHIKLELVDTGNRVCASAERDQVIHPGQSHLPIALMFSISQQSRKEQARILWYRLRYHITPQPSSSRAFSAVEGTISLSEATPDLFTLHAAVLEYAREGTRYRAMVRATHPISSRPASGVSIEAEVLFDDTHARPGLKASGVTDSDGYVSLEFDLPRDIETNEGEIKITGRRGELIQTAEGEIQLLRRAEILVSTDKPLYQPGQSLHIRALIFDESRHAIADAAATLTIVNPEGDTVFRGALKTSRFGVASADWAIPENTRLGEYRANVKLDIEKYGDSEGVQSIKITRYELPAFTVSVKPDRAYYLSGQNAEVEISADYLFGQPVARGRVQVARETERQWNYRQQKWEIKEGERLEGVTGKSGSFVAHIDLSKEYEDLYESDYSRFTDIEYAAYFTDITTGRTEQRRFNLRLTKDAIHVYVIGDDSYNAEGHPMQFYLSTFYADGKPAQCEVTFREIRTKKPGAWQTASSGDAQGQALGAIKTNAYGLAKVSKLMLGNRNGNSDEALLSFVARDNKGRTGHHTRSFSFTKRPVVKVETDKVLYRSGEPIKVMITSSAPEMHLVVDLAHDGKVIRAEFVRVIDGRAVIAFPYDKQFDGELTVAAYSYGGIGTTHHSYIFASRAVLYPREWDLKLDVQLNEPAYRPGEEARADFRVLAPDGSAASSSLGVVVFDKAIEERARTDQEFGAGSGFAYSISRLLESEGFAGVTRKDLERLDLSKPLPDGLDILAEVLLGSGNYFPQIFGGDDYEADQRSLFTHISEAQLKPVKDALNTRYARRGEYPRDAEALSRVLVDFGIEFDKLKDPWGMPYRPVFSVENYLDSLVFESAGADKQFGTGDDFIPTSKIGWPYFQPLGEAITRALERHHKRTSGFIRDEAALKREMLRDGISFDALRDRWGKPYQLQFGVSNTKFTVSVRSGGSNGRFDARLHDSFDDFTIWTSEIDYFKETREKLDSALDNYFKATGRFPQDEAGLSEAFQRAGINEKSLLDAWGHRYYGDFTNLLRYSSHMTVYSYARYPEPPKPRTDISPVMQRVKIIYLRSSGEDGKQGTADDFQAAAFSRIVAEHAIRNENSEPLRLNSMFSGATGAISVLVTDSQGAVIPNTTVKATNYNSLLSYEAKTSDEGRCILGNLPAGIYELRLEAQGFKSFFMTDVPVRSSNVTQCDATLDVGGVTELVTVSAGTSVLLTQAAATIESRQISSLTIGSAPVKPSAQLSTPRLREYFPETLVWQPSLETDSQGRAQLKFKLADNITTWKLAVIASTADGLIGVTEREIRAFQPFFIEHDPPRVLTENDEIALPIVVRNYLNKSQTVDLEIKSAPWFTLLGPARKQTEIAAGDASRLTFDFRAVAAIKDGKQRVIAAGSEANDAVEKSVSVHPNGEEVTQTSSDLFNDSLTLEINIPDTAIKDTARAELKIYPGLIGHVVESIEAIMQRPHGCAEQTISSTYPSILLLRYYKQNGEDVPPIALKARRYVQSGYELLLNYRDEQGGFSYWGRGEADLALTAYAVRFLRDASEFITVDEDVLIKARGWLINHQRADGSWTAHGPSSSEDQRQTALLTSHIARALSADARSSAADVKANTDSSQQQNSASNLNKQAGAHSAVTRALDYLTRRTNEIDEPYLLSSYALTALDVGETANATRAIEKLRTLARNEADGSFWNLGSNTPLYGWGMAGRIETTALAVQALSKYCGTRNSDCGINNEKTSVAQRRSSLKSETSTAQSAREDNRQIDPATGQSSSPRNSQLINRGLLFLIRQKDRYGVWHSTQATISVLDALITILSRQDVGARDAGLASELRASANGAAEILVNGRMASSVAMPRGQRSSGPISVDLSGLLLPGNNRVEIRRGAGSPQGAVQAVSTYYRPWSATSTTGDSNHKLAANALRLRVSFDKIEARIGEEVTCEVEVARLESAGNGMMLAEIGLPPGAEVDRASLDKAIKQSNWNLDQYDVLPDRLIVYVWPRTGGTRFQFKFRARFGISAQTAPSVLYDYYNPEARAVLKPTRFIVR